MSLRVKVYIAGPITVGDRNINFSQSVTTQQLLMRYGFAPHNPVLSMLAPFAWQILHKDWLATCLPWVAASDCVLRLPGNSAGADAEVAFAVERDIPVYWDVPALVSAYTDGCCDIPDELQTFDATWVPKQ